MVLQQKEGVQQQIVEVEGVGLLHTLLHDLVNACGLLSHRVACRVGEDVRNLQLVFRGGDAIAQSVDWITTRIDIELGHDLLHQTLRIGIVVNGEVLRETEHVSVGAQDANAHAVERGHPHAANLTTDDALQTLAHFGCGLVRERDGHDLPRSHAEVLDHMSDAVCKHTRLARASAGQYKQRPFGALGGLTLRAVQYAKIYRHGSPWFHVLENAPKRSA